MAFSRFQTKFFRTHLGAQLGKTSVTYGPCQSPTLWFCCHRHDQIATFIPRPYWSVRATVQLDGDGDISTEYEFTAVSGEVWEESAATSLVDAAGGTATLAHATADALLHSRTLPRPLPLNTVALLKCASERLYMGAGDTMYYAEKLYLAGLTSYPRTETSKYANGFDLRGTLRTLASAEWLPDAQAVLERAGGPPVAEELDWLHARARADGVDVGDHPPITPVKLASPKACGDARGYELYQLICQHFVATLSDDCELHDAKLAVSIGTTSFEACVTRCAKLGWAEPLGVAIFGRDDESTLRTARFHSAAAITKGAALRVSAPPAAHKHWTQPPPHLSESELLTLMEEHGVGTDASMATHVSNVIRRGYVQVRALALSAPQPFLWSLRPTALSLVSPPHRPFFGLSAPPHP